MSTNKASFFVHAIACIPLSCFIRSAWAASCGNNHTEAGELCGGTDSGGQLCTSLGFDSGTLACAADCSAFDTSGCVSSAVCGNGFIETGELCDGTELGGQLCADLGFDGGVLTCAADCSAFDTSGCVASATCGNNVIEMGVLCDGANLAGQSCADLGFGSGTLTCAADCGALDTSGCGDPRAGVKAQIAGIQEHLVQIEGGVVKLGENIEEIASARRAICDRPVSWNRKLPDGERFVAALNGHAYCDLETGLIWMEEPPPAYVAWKAAFGLCRVTEVDGRNGWNLPSVEQLSTLIDSQNVGSGPALPLGHPFDGPLGDIFWTSSLQEKSIVGRTRGVWLVDFGAGTLISHPGISSGSNAQNARVWCVRGAGGSPPISEVGFFGEN